MRVDAFLRIARRLPLVLTFLAVPVTAQEPPATLTLQEAIDQSDVPGDGER